LGASLWSQLLWRQRQKDQVQGQLWQKHETLSEKLRTKKARGMAQVVEPHLQCEILSSDPSTEKKKSEVREGSKAKGESLRLQGS
jgi:hypothetical protein